MEQPGSAGLRDEAYATPYFYSSLGEGYIRLVGIDPATGSSELRGVVEEYPLCDAPPYVALSYTWGVSALDHYFYVPRAIPVTASLHSSLALIRRLISVYCRYFWADAICIN
jgi:hypothetical protein